MPHQVLLVAMVQPSTVWPPPDLVAGGPPQRGVPPPHALVVVQAEGHERDAAALELRVRGQVGRGEHLAGRGGGEGRGGPPEGELEAGRQEGVSTVSPTEGVGHGILGQQIF